MISEGVVIVLLIMTISFTVVCSKSDSKEKTVEKKTKKSDELEDYPLPTYSEIIKV
jgi:hypothetical protein